MGNGRFSPTYLHALPLLANPPKILKSVSQPEGLDMSVDNETNEPDTSEDLAQGNHGEGDNIQVGDISGVGVAIGKGASSLVLINLPHPSASPKAKISQPSAEIKLSSIYDFEKSKDENEYEAYMLKIEIHNGEQDIDRFRLKIKFPNLEAQADILSDGVIGKIEFPYTSKLVDGFYVVTYSKQEPLFAKELRRLDDGELRYSARSNNRGLLDMFVFWELHGSDGLSENGQVSLFDLWNES
jgi:hypothetical protein